MTYLNRGTYSEYKIAICFNSNGNIDMKYAEEKLDLIKKYVIFLGYNPVELFWGTGIKPYSLFDKIMKL